MRYGARCPRRHEPGSLRVGAHPSHGNMVTVGEVDSARNGFDPNAMLTDWDTGTVSQLPNGQTLRKYEIVALDKEIEIAPGVFFPAWTYNGQVPGPTCAQRRRPAADRLPQRRLPPAHDALPRHPFGPHGRRAGRGKIEPVGEFVYEFDARPFGCHLYHCHAMPLKRHIHKGLYGAFIVNPTRPACEACGRRALTPPDTPENKEWQEFVMVMNAFDTNFDGENEVYAVNTVGHHYMKHPIRVDAAGRSASTSST